MRTHAIPAADISKACAKATQEGQEAARANAGADPLTMKALNPYGGGTIERSAWFTGMAEVVIHEKPQRRET
jgi:hypothetical protein